MYFRPSTKHFISHPSHLTRYTHAQGPRARGVVVFSLMSSLKLHRRCERRKSLSCCRRTLLAPLSCCLKCSLRSSVSLSLCLWTLSRVKRLAGSWAAWCPRPRDLRLACPTTSSYASSDLWPPEDVPRDYIVDYVRERTVSWCRLRITPYTIQIRIDNCIPEALQI